MAAWVRPAGSSAPWRRIEVSRVYTAGEDPPRTFSVRFRYFNSLTFSTQPPDSPERPAACFSGLAAGDAPELGFVEESIRTAEPMCTDHPLVKLETEVPTGPLELGFFAVPVMTWVPLDGLAGTYSYEISATCAGGCAEPAGTCSLPASL